MNEKNTRKMKRMNESKRQKICKKIDKKVNLMIIYFRYLQSYLIHSILTSPSWGNGEVVLGLRWPKVAVAAKVAVKHVKYSTDRGP